MSRVACLEIYPCCQLRFYRNYTRVHKKKTESKEWIRARRRQRHNSPVLGSSVVCCESLCYLMLSVVFC